MKPDVTKLPVILLTYPGQLLTMSIPFKDFFEDVGRFLCFSNYLLSSYSPFVAWTNEKQLTQLLLVQESCKRVVQFAVLSKVTIEAPFLVLAIKVLTECSFLTKNCSYGPSELTKVSY